MANYVLEILDGDRAGEVVPVTDSALRIGRKPGNDIILADDKTSGVHAEVAPEGDRFVLRDLGSTNGTLLDGKKVTEVVLSPGDTFQIGKVRLRFRDAAAAPAGDASLQVQRLDASRLQGRRGSRSVALLLVLLVVAGGAAGYLFWQQRGGDEGGSQKSARRAPLEVPGNKLLAGIGAAESDAGWNLAAAGSGFVTGAGAHTGTLAFVATRASAGGSAADGPAEPADHALAALREPLVVLGGRPLQLAAHVKTSGGGLVGVRAVFTSSVEGNPFRFRSGTALVTAEQWTRIHCDVCVPPGADRCGIELVAVLPSVDAMAAVDDIALTEGGAAVAHNLKLEESGQLLLGTGPAIAVRSTDPEQPAVLLGCLPDRAPAPLQGLLKAGLLCWSDLGAGLTVEKGDRSFALAVQPPAEPVVPDAASACEAMQLVFPSEAAVDLLVETDEGFMPAAADGSLLTKAVLLGDRTTRCLVQLSERATCVGRTGAGVYRLQVPPRCELVLQFRAERQAAGELLRQATADQKAGQPGAALDRLRELQRLQPHDHETLVRARALRSELLAVVAERLRQLQADLDEAEFFDTRGGFARVVAGVDDLVALWFAHNLDDREALRALRERAATRLGELDAQRSEELQQRLQALVAAFTEANQPALAKLVQDHLARHAAGGARGDK